jgi:hypothetical protein
MTAVIPPLAGLCTHAEGSQAGPSVDATVDRLRRYAYLKQQLMFILAERFNATPEWEAKGAFSVHLWQDAEHATWFRTRVTEMRTPPHHLDRAPDPALSAFVGQLRQARDTVELLAGVYQVAKQALAGAFREHLREAHPLTDHPTRRLLTFALLEDDQQLAWGGAAVKALLQQQQRGEADAALQAWTQHLQAYLAAAGGVNGNRPRLPAAELPAARTDPTDTSRVPKRDARFPHVWNSRGVVPSAGQPVHERIWWMMNVRLNEMHVSELIATVIADWKDQPWDFYRDLARHLWDETRHCMLGEIAFASQGIDITQIPTHTGFAEYPNTTLPPPERYAFLWGIEQGLMVKSGKQAELALAQAGRDERAAVFQDFDWADEVLHAQIGRRWLEPKFGSREKMGEIYDKIRPFYDQMKDEDLKKPGRDWWPAFYAKHLKHKDPNLGQVVPGAPSSAGTGY